MPRLFGILLVTLLMFAVPACNRKKPVPPAPVLSADGMDWSSITAVPEGNALFGVHILARKMDLWHAGTKATADLTYAQDAFSDGQGHTLKTPPALWKGIIEHIRRDRRGFVQEFAMPAHAPKDNFIQLSHSWGEDSEGSKPAYQYRFSVTDEDTIRVALLRKVRD